MLQSLFKTAIILPAVLLLSNFSNVNAYAEPGGGVNLVDVKVLSIKGCQATPPTIELVEAVAKEMDISINLNVIVIKTPGQAKENRFVGSPTVQINDLDIEPASREIEFFGVT